MLLQKNYWRVRCSAIKQGHLPVQQEIKGVLIEEANKGALFLDEIGEMHIDLQSKLLRVLETNEFIKVGDTKPTKVNVRIIAATNRDLKKRSKKENFGKIFFTG